MPKNKRNKKISPRFLGDIGEVVVYLSNANEFANMLSSQQDKIPNPSKLGLLAV